MIKKQNGMSQLIDTELARGNENGEREGGKEGGVEGRRGGRRGRGGGQRGDKNTAKKALFASVCVCPCHSGVSVCVHVHLVRVPLKGLLRNWRPCRWRCSRPSPILGVITHTENEK